jgi:hypothetical protein
MSENPSNPLDNYPDILGYITNNVRTNVNVVQLATALRPRVAMAGRPLEMLLLVQNAADVPVDVSITLKLPALDAKKQKGRFQTKSERLVIKLEGAMVGLATLPLLTLADTAVSADYKIGMEVKVTPTGNQKPARVRHVDGGGVVETHKLPEKSQELVESLKKLPWTASVVGGAIESKLTIMSGKVGAFADLEPSWTSLWIIGDYQDELFLLHRIAPLLTQQILPALVRREILPVMQEYTTKHFSDVGYKLSIEEMDAIARYLTYVLECANPAPKDAPLLVGNPLNLRQHFDEDGTVIRAEKSIGLPHWLKDSLKVFSRDARTAQFPLKTIAHFAYFSLLKDAMLDGFSKIEDLIGDVGTTEERLQYIEQVLEAMRGKTLKFDTLYMPLILGALTTTDKVVLRGESSGDIAKAMRVMVDNRYKEQTDDSKSVFDMAKQLVLQTNMKY